MLLVRFSLRNFLLFLSSVLLVSQASQAQNLEFQTWNSGNEGTMTASIFRTVTIDKLGTIWAGSDLGGLYYYTNGAWTKANTYSDISFRHLVPSNIPGDVNVWAVSNGKTGIQAISGGAYHINALTKVITQYGAGFNNGGLSARTGNSLVMSSTGFTYVALSQSITAGNINQGGVFRIQTANPPAPSSTSFTKAIFDNGDINYYSAGSRGDELWFGRGGRCNNGVCDAAYIARLRSDGTPLPSITAASSGLPFTNAATSAFARAIYTDTVIGNTFVGLSRDGIGVMRPNGTWKLLNSTNSPLPLGASVNFNAITEVYGEIWIGTSNGVFVYDGVSHLDSMSSFKMLTTENGLPSDFVTDIAVDTARGELWITSNVGISRTPYAPPIKGVVLNVYCNKPGKTIEDKDFFIDVLQKEPLTNGVTVKLLEGDNLVDSAEVNEKGIFELTKTEKDKLYTVEIQHFENDSVITLRFHHVKANQYLGGILIPAKLINEVQAFKKSMMERCFSMDVKFGFKGDICREYGFFVDSYEASYEKLFSKNGIESNHRKHVDNLADFYLSLATVYQLGGQSASLVDQSVKSVWDGIQALLEFTSFLISIGKTPEFTNMDELKRKLSLAAMKAKREPLITALKLVARSIDDPDVKQLAETFATCISDISNTELALLSEPTVGVSFDKLSPKVGLELLRNLLAVNISALYYKSYAQQRHKNFIAKAAVGSKNSTSQYSYEQTFSRLFAPNGSSIAKSAGDTLKKREDEIFAYGEVANYASIATELTDAASAFYLLPGAQLAGAIAKGLSLALRGVQIYAISQSMFAGFGGSIQIAKLSDQILPYSGLVLRQGGVNKKSDFPSAISTEQLQVRKNSYLQKLAALKPIYNLTSFDSTAYFTKYNELADEDLAYSDAMSDVLNSLWAAGDSAVKQIPGFDYALRKVVDSFINQQYVLREAFFFQNLGYIFDTDKTSYVSDLNNMLDNISRLNDSAVNALTQLANAITSYNVEAPAYLVQKDYRVNHSHLPNSTGTLTYIFQNYGTEPMKNVSFKISQPTAGYTILSPDSIYVGTLPGGQAQEITFKFTAPEHDSVSLYTIDIKADNGRFNDVSGTFYVNIPTKYYSIKPGNWSNPSTWSTNAIPGATSKVMISHNVIVDIDATCLSLETVSPGILKVSSGKKLTILQ
jgi:hypothetical protein